MNGNQRNYKGQFEINDLIGDAVKNAVARRNQAMDSEGALLALCDEEGRSVAGASSLLTTTGRITPAPFSL